MLSLHSMPEIFESSQRGHARSIPIFYMECVISKQCAACGQVFRPRPQFPDQTYCSVPECQREQRRHWQQEKRRTDPDYRDNQNRAHKPWAEDNPEYWGVTGADGGNAGKGSLAAGDPRPSDHRGDS